MVLTGFSRTSGLVLKNKKIIKYEDYPIGIFQKIQLKHGNDIGIDNNHRSRNKYNATKKKA